MAGQEGAPGALGPRKQLPEALTLLARLHGARWLLEGACVAAPSEQPQLAALAASMLLGYLELVNDIDSRLPQEERSE